MSPQHAPHDCDPSGQLDGAPVAQPSAQPEPRHVHTEAVSHDTAHRPADPQSTSQIDPLAQATEQSLAPPHVTPHDGEPWHVTPHRLASSHATSHVPPWHAAAQSTESAHARSHDEALHAHASSVQMHVPPEHATSGSLPHPSAVTTNAIAASAK